MSKPSGALVLALMWAFAATATFVALIGSPSMIWKCANGCILAVSAGICVFWIRKSRKAIKGRCVLSCAIHLTKSERAPLLKRLDDSYDARCVLVDATHLTKSERAPLLKLIDNSYDARYVLLNATHLTKSERKQLETQNYV